jgi:hypothetical protein
MPVSHVHVVAAALGGAALSAGGPSHAAFTGITFEQDSFALDGVTPLAALQMPSDFRVFNIYATFSQPLDQAIGVSGSPEIPFCVFVQGQETSFYNHPLGDPSGGPQHQLFINLVPELNWDSFFTIGARSVEELGFIPGHGSVILEYTPEVFLGPPDSGKWGAGEIGMDMGWSVPVEGPSSFAGPDLRVLLMRLTVQEPAKVIEGSFGVLTVLDGVVQAPVPGSFKTALPAPGVSALLVLAGLAGGRRRPRSFRGGPALHRASRLPPLDPVAGPGSLAGWRALGERMLGSRARSKEGKTR